MKIAVTGKGGVGKTTFAACLARLYADEGRKVLCADVDPDANLGLALGAISAVAVISFLVYRYMTPAFEDDYYDDDFDDFEDDFEDEDFIREG